MKISEIYLFLAGVIIGWAIDSMHPGAWKSFGVYAVCGVLAIFSLPIVRRLD